MQALFYAITESKSDFSDKHSFCARKSEAPREAGRE